jgi:AcrR family transcriptional regulator
MLDVRISGPGSNLVLTHRMNVATPTDRRLKSGRPRKFNQEEAVEAAMRVFWDKGYEGASLRDLTEAMGIDRKSMYLTLGDKEALFLKALECYSLTHLSFLPKALEKPTLREFVDELFNAAIRFWTDKSHPEACLSIQNLAVSDEAESIKRALMDWRAWGLEQFRKRALRARAEGDLPKEIKPEAFARYLAVIMSGLAHQAATGATLPELKQAIKMFRQTMPFDVEDSTTR